MKNTNQGLKSIDLETYKKALKVAPLAVYGDHPPAYRSIPASIRPLCAPKKSWNELTSMMPLMLSALEKAVFYVRSEKKLMECIYGGLSPIESYAAQDLFESKLAQLATIRSDFFFADDDTLRILEFNTTIPAMQAYSDMILESFCKAMGLAFDEQKSNSQGLLDSLLNHYHLRFGRSKTPRIAIIARKNDSQLAELKWLLKKWTSILGEGRVFLGTPDHLSLDQKQIFFNQQKDDLVPDVGMIRSLQGGDQEIPIDIVYRHIFAYRLEPESALNQALQRPDLYCVLNAVAAHYEAKALMALVSSAASLPKYYKLMNLDDSEREAVKLLIPWTRLLNTSDLGDLKRRHPDELVLKASMGYGGQQVFLGAEFASETTQRVIMELTQSESPVAWQDFLDWCSTHGTWVVQERVQGKKISHSYLDKDGSLKEEESFVDCSGFWFPGLALQGGQTNIKMGGAARFANNPIVNIGKGGGMLPFLVEDLHF